MVRKKALKQRRGERGAALFIVVMITTLLTAIGLFAVRTSSMVERAAGFARKASQAFYVSEFSIRAVASDIAGKEDTYLSCLEGAQADCRTAANLREQVGALGTPISCCVKDEQQLGRQLQEPLLLGMIGNVPEGGYIGTLSRPSADLTQGTESTFRVELTDLGPAPNKRAGDDLNQGQFEFKQITVTATGQVRPQGSLCTADTAQASSVQSLRGYITFLASR